jgi:type I restriction enzyme, S subunit
MPKELTIENTSLPVGWEMKIFDEVINFSQIGLVRNNKEQSLEYTYRYLKMNNINNDNGLNEDSFKFVNATSEEVKRYQLSNDDFLFNTRNSFELVGKNCLYKSDYTKPTLFNNNILRVRFKDFLFPEFAAYAFSSKAIIDNLEKIKSGTTNVVGIYYKSLKYLEIPIPPLFQQKQIVATLDKAFAAIETAKANAEKNLQNAKELFESYLQNVFENKGDDWEEKTLNEVYDVRDGTHDSPKYINEGYALITSKNLKNDELNYNKIKYISEQDYININKRSKVDKGDVLFAMIGTIGNPIVIKKEPDFAIKNVALFKIPLKQSSYFLKYYLDSSFVIDKMIKDAKGATQKFVGLGYLRSFPISLPPLAEQEELVKKLNTLSLETKKLEAIYSQKIADLEEMKKSVLQKAFSGQLNTIN